MVCFRLRSPLDYISPPTGGTGRFAGITGGGKVLIRSDARQIAAVSDSMTKDEGAGILYVPELHYTLP